jgi:choline kinase
MATRGVILAAGRGIRMGGAAHKSLMPVEGNEPLLYYMLAGLKKAGISDLMVVTGHAASEVEEFVAKYWEGEATFTFNPRYASWGNFHSLRVAIDQSPGFNLLAVNCDIVIHPEVLTRVLQQPGDLVLAIEKRLRLDDEDMRVRLSGDRVAGIGKHLPRAHGHGEFCGVSLLRPDAATAYQETATQIEWQGETGIYYEDVYARLLDAVDGRAAAVNAGEYAEVDEPANVAQAARVIQSHRDVWEVEAPAAPQ